MPEPRTASGTIVLLPSLLPIGRDDQVVLADGRVALVCEAWTTDAGRRWITACPVGTEMAIYVLAEEVRRI
jgi:hypothetical protein